MDPLDDKTATISGFWLGAAGALVSLAGLALSLFGIFGKTLSVFWLALSGWAAATLLGLFMGYVSVRMLARMQAQQRRLEELSGDVARLTDENTRLVSISDYIASRAMTRATPRAPKPAASVPQGE